MRINGRTLGKEYRFQRNGAGGDVFLCDDIDHFLTFPDDELKVGDTIEYEVTYEFDDIAHLPLFPLYNDVEISRYELRIRYPKDIEVRPRVFHVRDSIPFTVQSRVKGELVLSCENVSPTDPLKAFPFNSLHGILILEVYESGRLLTPTTAEEFINWYSRNVSMDPCLDTAAGFSATDTIGRFAEPRAQLAAIHDWVRTHIRYIADSRSGHSIFPHQPSEVLQTRYGDCKDRAYLVCALAREFGLTVRMGVVATTFRPSLDRIVHWMQYDHVICHFTDSVGEVFFDPTAQYHAFEDPPTGILEHAALILDPDEPRQVAVTSSDTTADLDIQFDAHVDSLRVARATVVLRKDRLGAMRYARSEQTGLPLEELYRRVMGEPVAPVALSRFTVEEESSRFIRVTATADLAGLVVLSPTKAYLPAAAFPVVTPEIAERSADTLPLYFDDQTTVHMQLTLRGLQGGQADTVVRWGDRPSGESFTSVTTDSIHTVTYIHDARRLGKVLAGADKTAHLDFCARYLKERKPTFTFKRGKV